MVSTRVATAEEVARYFLEITEDKSVFRRMWTYHDGDAVQIWIMTEPIDFETEKQLYRLEQRLYEKFPNTLIDVWVLNLRLSDSPDLSFLVPRNAKLFDLS